jgi:hypothetical protein
MPQTPDASGSPKVKARMMSGWPRPITAGSASCAPDSASTRIRGRGLISLFTGMKPETIAPARTGTGNGRAAMACAAAVRRSGGNASRRAWTSRRMTALAASTEEAIDRKISWREM